MNCPRCAAAAPEGSAFCPRCGAALSPAAASAPPAAPPVETERELWRGRYSGKAAAHWWILLLLWWCGLIGASFVFEDQQELMVFLLPAIALLPFLILAGRVLFLKASVRYRLTTHRLFKDVGIFRRTHSELELMRVDDLSVRQNLIQRALRVGTVSMVTSDSSDPRLELEGISDPDRVKEMIRDHVLKRRARTLHMESL